MEPGTSVTEVARASGVNANKVFKWRWAFKRGELIGMYGDAPWQRVESDRVRERSRSASLTGARCQRRLDPHRVSHAVAHGVHARLLSGPRLDSRWILSKLWNASGPVHSPGDNATLILRCPACRQHSARVSVMCRVGKSLTGVQPGESESPTPSGLL